MKKIKVFLTVAALAFAVFAGAALAACGGNVEEKTVVAYGKGYNDHYIRVEMTVDAEKNVKNVKIEEFLSLKDLGLLRNSDSVSTVIADHKEGEGNSAYAKFIKVGDKIFLYSGSDYVNSDESAVTVDNDFIKWYIERMEQGDFAILKNATGTQRYSDTEIPFTKYRTEETTVTKSKWANKTVNGYTLSSSATKTIAQSFKAMEDAIKEHGLESYNPQTDDAEQKIGGNATGATLTNYNKYMAVVMAAYNSAKADLGI